MAETDAFKFSELKIFEGIREDNLPDDAKEIFDVYEDMLFFWEHKNFCIKVVNYRRLAQSKSIANEKVQTLIPASIQNIFTVSKILMSYGGSYCALSGSQGLALIELPSRWGVDGLYFNGKPQITCKIINIHEYASNQLEVVQIRWHPDSPSDSHLFVLYSDNSLRLYENEGILKQTWRIGQSPSQSNAGRKFSFLQTLGDTAIDFDICPAQVCNEPNTSFIYRHQTIKEDQRKIEWPIVILRGNGTVYVLSCRLNSETAQLQGPLLMFPSQKNNYGHDCCSIIVIPSYPITIVVAESSGILHHALLVENKLENKSFDDSKKLLRNNDWDLYVLENIELKLGMQNEPIEQEKFLLHLKKDPINENRYFCYHETGLHGITTNFINQLQKFNTDENVEYFNSTVASRVEHILSTRAFSDSKVNAVIGFALLQSPSGIIALMRSGQIVSLSTIKSMPLSSFQHTNLKPPNLELKVIDQLPKISFDQHVKMLLNGSQNSQPILKLDKLKLPSSKQAFQLLMNSIQTMRELQFKKHDNVRQEIMKRVRILEMMKNQQRDEIIALLEFKKVIQENAYRLADKHEDIIERQLRVQTKIDSTCSRLLSLKLPTNTVNEKEFFDRIKSLKVGVDKLSQDVCQIKIKHESQKKSSDKETMRTDEGTTSLPQKQEESIKEFMKDMMRQIQILKSDVQNIYNVIES